MATVEFEFNGIINDYKFRCIKLPNGMKVLLISAFKYNTGMVGVNVLGAGNINQKLSPDCPPMLPRLVARALDIDNDSEISANFKKRIEYQEKTTGEDFAAFHTVFRDTEPELKAVLNYFSEILNSPIFSGSELETALNKMIESMKEDFSYDENKRIEFIHRLTANVDHPYANKFKRLDAFDLSKNSTEELTDAAISYFHKHYHPRRMFGLVQSSKSLPELESLVIETFGKIQANEIELLPEFDFSYKSNYPFESAQCGQYLKIEPVDEGENILKVKFYIPIGQEKGEEYHSAGIYLENVISSTLEETLQERGWLRSNAQKFETLFTIDVEYPYDGALCLLFDMKLTEAGMKNVDQVIEHVFALIFALEKQPILDWFWNEIKIKKVSRRRMYNNCVISNAWAEDALAELTLTENPERAIKTVYETHLSEKLDESLVADILGKCTVENARIILMSNAFEKSQTKELFGIKYKEEGIKPEILQRWSSIRNGKVDLGIDYATIPDSSKLIPSVEEFAGFSEMRDQDPIRIDVQEISDKLPLKFSQLWFQPNKSLQFPEVFVRIEIVSPAVNADTKSRMSNLLYAFLAGDCFRNEVFYPSCSEMATGIGLSVDWFSCKISEAVNTVIKSFFEFIPDKKSFNSLRLCWKGIEIGIHKSDGAPNWGRGGEALLKPLIIPKDKITAYADMTYDDMLDYIKKFRERIKLKWLFYGKIDPSEAAEIVKNAEKILIDYGSVLASEEEICPRKQVEIPKGTKWFYNYETEPTATSMCTNIYFQNVDFGPKPNILVAFLANLLNNEMHESLGIGQGLCEESEGYFNAEATNEIDSRNSLNICINKIGDNSTHCIFDIAAKINELLLQFQKTLQTMTNKVYTDLRDAFAVQLWNPTYNEIVVERLFHEIINGELKWKRCEEYIGILKSVEKEEFIKFYEEFVGIVPGKVRKLTLVVGGSDKMSEEGNCMESKTKPIDNLQTWVENLPTTAHK